MLYNSISHLPESIAIYTWIARLAPWVHVQLYSFLFQEFAKLKHLISGYGLKVSMYGISERLQCESEIYRALPVIVICCNVLHSSNIAIPTYEG